MQRPLIDPVMTAMSKAPAIVAVAKRTDEGRLTLSHQHARGQLLGAFHGLLSVQAGGSTWIVPATHAVWIPPSIIHAARSHGPFAGWSVYIAAAECADLPTHPCVLALSGLMREVVLRAASWVSEARDPSRRRLSGVILDEIRRLPMVTLGLPMPSEPRLLRIAQGLLAQPGDDRRLEDWAQWAAVAPRTLTRRFAAETGFTFNQWRQRLRLLRALEMLAVGKPVTMVALDLGYENVSAFIALFRRTLGATPGRYFAAPPWGRPCASSGSVQDARPC